MVQNRTTRAGSQEHFIDLCCMLARRLLPSLERAALGRQVPAKWLPGAAIDRALRPLQVDGSYC
jgi:hypothetical protein